MNTKFFKNIPEIDNSGQGNCMYYAYSISLMSYLRAQSKEMTEFIFNQLEISPENQASLFGLLSAAKDRPANNKLFSRDEIKNSIEPLLAHAIRQYGAKVTKEDFLSKPMSSSLYGPANYGMINAFKLALKNQDNSLANLLNNDFDVEDYTEADIFKVSGMKSAMDDYAKKEAQLIINEFNQTWPQELVRLRTQLDNVLKPQFKNKLRINIAHELIAAKQPEIFAAIKHQLDTKIITRDEFNLGLLKILEENHDLNKAVDERLNIDWPTEEEKLNRDFERNSEFQKRNFLENCIGRKTIDFFNTENNHHLNRYIDRLKTNFVWGTEETLVAIHRHLQGEKITHDETTDTNITTYAYPFRLAIFQNGVPPDSFNVSSDIPGLIINNHGNYHWTSLITAPSMREQEEILNEKSLRQNILTLSGFELCLSLLTYKLDYLKKGHHSEAYNELNTIHKGLQKHKTDFLSGNNPKNREQDVDVLARACKETIGKAPKEHLEKHRSIFGILLNALKSIAALCLSPFVSQKFHVLEPSPTDSIAKIEKMADLLQQKEVETVVDLFKSQNSPQIP